MKNDWKRRGFTLVELLIVIAIISVLTVISMAVVRSARDKANTAKALKSLNQAALLGANYALDNNGDINTYRDSEKPADNGSTLSASYWGRTQPFFLPQASVDNDSTFKNELSNAIASLMGTKDIKTMSGTAIFQSKIKMDQVGLPIPFAFNRNLYDADSFVKTSRINDMAQTIYMTLGYEFFDFKDAQTYVKRPTKDTVPSNHIYYMPDQTMLAAYLDGHCETLKAPIAARKINID